MPRFFFAGDIGDIHQLQVWYVLECKVLMRKEKERVCKPLGITAKISPPIQSVNWKWFKITKKFAKKCLDASSHA